MSGFFACARGGSLQRGVIETGTSLEESLQAMLDAGFDEDTLFALKRSSAVAKSRELQEHPWPTIAANPQLADECLPLVLEKMSTGATAISEEELADAPEAVQKAVLTEIEAALRRVLDPSWRSAHGG